MRKGIFSGFVAFMPFLSTAFADEISSQIFSCSCSNDSASVCSQIDVSQGVSELECTPNKDLCDDFNLTLDLLRNEVNLCADPFFACSQSKATIYLVGQNTYYSEGSNSGGDGDFQITFDAFRSRLHVSVAGPLTEFFGSINGTCTPQN